MAEALPAIGGDDDNPVDTRRRRFLEAINWGWLGMGLLGLASLPFYPERFVLLTTIIVTTCLTFFLVRQLVARGRIRAACILFSLLVNLGLFGIFLILADERGLSRALETEVPALMMMGLAILFAGALVHPSAPFLLASLNSAALAVLVLLSGSDDPRFSIHTFWWLLALIAWLYERTLRDAFGRVSAAQQNLQNLVDQRTGELRASVRKLSRTMSALETSNRELDAFASAVSHDLRAPVRSIIGFSDALHEEHAERLDEEGLEHLERVRRAGRRMHALIDDLLRLSRVTRRNMKRESVDLGAVGNEVIDELRRAEPERNVRFQAAEGVMVRGDGRLLRVLLENLIGNAWKFTKSRDQARIVLGEAERSNGERVCFVRDNGVGFDMAYAEKLFRPFQRLHARRDFDGTGIGLATAQRIVHRHNGRIWAEAKKEDGAAFFFTLGDSTIDSAETEPNAHEPPSE